MKTVDFKEKRVVLPLVGTSYEPGSIEKAINDMEDEALAEIARAEAFFFTAQAEKCVELTRRYLDSDDMMLRLSADMLYTFANLTLGNAYEAQLARTDVYECMKKICAADCPDKLVAAGVFAYNVTSTFLHIPLDDDMPSLGEYLQYLPVGQRMFAVSLLAHGMYLKGEYAMAQGAVQMAMLMSESVYPIAMVYMGCVKAMCQINQKDQAGAVNSVTEAWELAKKDRLLEPFIEYHGLLQGVMEVCIRKSEPEIYKKLVEGIMAFSRGWMKIHNPQSKTEVTDLLTPIEYSIAMLACRDWTNQEIASYLGMSVNTVKHYVSVILEKLNIDKRDKIKDYVNQ